MVQYVSVSVCSVFADHKNKSITGIQNGTFCATTRNKLFLRESLAKKIVPLPVHKPMKGQEWRKAASCASIDDL